METTNVKKNKKGNKFISLIKKHKRKILMLILACITIYIVYMVINLVRDPTDTVFVENGKIQEEEQAVGYIVRNETVLKGENYKNGIEQIKTEGEKVAKDEKIFRYFSNNEENLVEKIEELDKKIDEAISKESGLPSQDTQALEQQIDKAINGLYGARDISKIQDVKQDINNNMTKKAKIKGEYSPSGSYLNKLINERSKYENELNANAEYLTANRSGIVSYRVDGYETVFTEDDFGKYNKEFLESLNLRTGQIIPSSNESGKIIDNYYCYIVCVLTSDYARDAEIGDEVTLKLPSGNEVEASIEYKMEDSGDYILTFRIKNGVEELISYRKVSFTVIWWSKSGLKIPNSAILTEEVNGKEVSYVTRTRLGYEDKILVKVLKSNEKYSIVTKYTSEELTELGYDLSEITNMPNIAIYDEILINK